MELRAFPNPPKRLVHVLCAVEMLIEGKQKDFVWNEIRPQLQNSSAYLQRLINLKFDEVTVEMAEFVKQKINSDPECTVAKLSQVSGATSKILAWLLAVLDSCEQRFAALS